jgi:NAD(P)-dependent dehydrogenase (short-subunit alcohol dehydrogenase family)
MPMDKKFPALNELINLKDKRALVTGGASGIGLASTGRLAEAGAEVTIVDLDTEKGRAACLKLNQAGLRVFFTGCDVSQEDEAVKAVKSSVEQMGGLDILVNNAGIFPVTPLLTVTASDIEKILAVNLKGLIYFSREAVRQMIEQKNGGNIINITSVDALHPIRKNMAVYDASKGAVLAITHSMAKELAIENIRVNAVAPGGILTEGAISSNSETGSRAGLRETISRIPLGRMGAADDIARVVLFLASDLSAYMTGSLITVDGGYMVS